MKRTLFAAAGILVLVSAAYASEGNKELKAGLDSYEEVPAVSSIGSGEFRARISNDETEIAYELNYADLEGSVQQAHIHLAQPGVNGSILVFLCTNLGNGPAGTQPCPASPATITGTIDAADVTGNAATQGIAAGEFGELLRAIRARKTYVNVHTTLWPGGEIRGTIQPGKGEHHH